MRRAGHFSPRLLICAIAGLMLALAPVAWAQEEQATEEQPKDEQPEEAQAKEAEQSKGESSAETDEAFAKSFLGKTYARDLEIEGWTDLGGGLVLPPIYVHQYQRDDGTFLVLTSRELTPATSSAPASYVVADALIVPPPQEGTDFTIACVQGEDETLRFMGEARGKEDKEWWTDVRRAWEISIETGEITEAKTRGIRCTNISWGQ